MTEKQKKAVNHVGYVARQHSEAALTPTQRAALVDVPGTRWYRGARVVAAKARP